jgi:hypothetical protein
MRDVFKTIMYPGPLRLPELFVDSNKNPAFRKAIFSRLVKEGIMTAGDADNLMRETIEEIKDGDTFGNVFRRWEKAG